MGIWATSVLEQSDEGCAFPLSSLQELMCSFTRLFQFTLEQKEAWSRADQILKERYKKNVKITSEKNIFVKLFSAVFEQCLIQEYLVQTLYNNYFKKNTDHVCHRSQKGNQKGLAWKIFLVWSHCFMHIFGTLWCKAKQLGWFWAVGRLWFIS